jgi:hypothetical protein
MWKNPANCPRINSLVIKSYKTGCIKKKLNALKKNVIKMAFQAD